MVDARVIAPPERVLVTGASGYIGGRLVPRLLERGYRVRCVGRSLGKLRARPFAGHPEVEFFEADVADPERLEEAMRGCAAAFYLVHSMVAAGKEYRERDRRLAANFAHAAREGGVERIVYLGGLGETGEGLSEHLASRREVERELAGTDVPLTTFRAAMIIGSGSASFEILRYLVERLPVMITPRWVRVECQPIAIRNVLHILSHCLEVPESAGETLDIGGPEVRTYRELMAEMASCLGLGRRIVIPVPVLTPRLSAGWIHLVTPLTHRIARPLAEGLRNRVVARDDRAQRLFPQRYLGVREAFDAALGKIHRADVETKWSDAGPMPGDPDWAGGTIFRDRRQCVVDAPHDAVYRAFARLGGDHGYYAADWLWHVRGVMDRLVGGPGLRRGRRHPEQTAYGEAIDFWRVTGIEPGHFLELRAEMKLPGVAELAMRADPLPVARSEDLVDEQVLEERGPCDPRPSEQGALAAERTTLTLDARFKPRGLFGLLYWYGVVPFHGIVFSGMLRGIARAATEDFHSPRSTPSSRDAQSTSSVHSA